MTESFAGKNKERRIGYNFEGDNWEMESDLKYISIAVRQAERKLKKSGLNGMEIVDLITSLGEILMNAVFHGNYGIKNRPLVKGEVGTPGLGLPETWDAVAKRVLKENPKIKNKKVHISFSITEKEVKIVVVDEGKGFN